MARRLHTTKEWLCTICNSDFQWIRSIRGFDQIIIYNDEKFPSEEEYLKSLSGDIYSKIKSPLMEPFALLELHSLPKMKIEPKFQLSSYDEIANDVFISDVFSNEEIPKGVMVISSNNMNLLTTSFDEYVYKDDEFSWKSFLKKEDREKVSNSFIICDRYLFTSAESAIKLGVKNITKLLDNIIQCDVKEEYQILFILNHDQLIQRKQKESKMSKVEVIDTITEIDESLRKKLKNVKKLRTEYLVVNSKIKVNPDNETYWADIIQNNLYYFTHDRIILSNYFHIRATHGFIAANESGKSDKTQLLIYRSLFSGTDNDSQKESSLPIRGDKKTIGKFIKFIEEIPEERIVCYAKGIDDRFIHKIAKNNIKNRLLSIPKELR